LSSEQEERKLIDVIVRTKNSEQSLRECLQAIYREIPINRVLIVDGGSTDRTLKIASDFSNVSIYVKPELNLGQATQFAFSKATTEWVAIIDSDLILKKGWFRDMEKNMKQVDAVEGCETIHYKFDVQVACTKLRYGRFSNIILKKAPVLGMDLDMPFGEDAAVSYIFKKQGLKWRKVNNYLADHYPKTNVNSIRRTEIVFKPDPYVIYIPKKIQVEQGHIARKYHTTTKREVLRNLVFSTIYEAYRAYKKNIWFCLAYFKLI
jgi:glycosyltransferase involved in cell wall biosynthesis